MIKSQADQRRPQHMQDQHGRPWYADIEKGSGMPTGVVREMFSVPNKRLVPPQKYLVFSTENPGKVTIDYDAWIRDAEVAVNEWEQRRIETIAALPGGAKNPMLARVLGPKPMSPLPIVAMRQGNSWALGFSPVKPPEAHEFFPDPITAPAGLVFSETPQVFSEGEKPKRKKVEA